MRGANVDDMGVAVNLMVDMIKADLVCYIVFVQQSLQCIHGSCVILGIVEGNVANLMRG